MLKRLLARKFSLPSGRSAPLRPWLNRLTWSGDSALCDFGSTGWICRALGEIFKLATLCNGLFRLDQFFDNFFYSTWSFFGHLMHLDTYFLGYSLPFAIYSLVHFKDKLSHFCTWLIITLPLISFRKLFTWPLFALGLHLYLANHWTWTLFLSTLFRLDQNILVTNFGHKRIFWSKWKMWLSNSRD